MRKILVVGQSENAMNMRFRADHSDQPANASGGRHHSRKMCDFLWIFGVEKWLFGG